MLMHRKIPNFLALQLVVLFLTLNTIHYIALWSIVIKQEMPKWTRTVVNDFNRYVKVEGIRV
jgi:uncharacterized RDD family membrane protein YckC